MNFKRVPLIPLFVLCMANAASAHVISTGLGPLYDGATHLILSPEHLIPVVAIGLFTGLHGSIIAKRSLFLLPIAWLLGGGLCTWIGMKSAFPYGAISFLVLGLLIAWDAAWKIVPVTLLTVAIGIIHGWIEGTAREAEGGSGISAIGSAATATLVFLLSAGFVLSLKPKWSRIMIRVLGSWVAATGLLLLGWQLRA